MMPADAILAEDSVAAGVAAMERIHRRHLADMNADEQATARDHWRRQVEEVLAAVRAVHAGPAAEGAGRAGRGGGGVGCLLGRGGGGEEMHCRLLLPPRPRGPPGGAGGRDAGTG